MLTLRFKGQFIPHRDVREVLPMIFLSGQIKLVGTLFFNNPQLALICFVIWL